MQITLELAYASCCGRVRRNNEDNLLLDGKLRLPNGPDLWPPRTLRRSLAGQELLAVFDGMGGEANGEEASYAAAVRLQELHGRAPFFYSGLTAVVQSLNKAVYRRGMELKTTRMGTTLAALLLQPDEVVVCNLGDSPIYLMRGDRLRQVSHDHTDAEDMLRRGIKNRKPYLTQYLGMDPEEITVEPYLAFEKLLPDDRWLLCSDGLTDMVPAERIEALLRAYADPQLAATVLVQESLDNGGRDNVTLILARVV